MTFDLTTAPMTYLTYRLRRINALLTQNNSLEVAKVLIDEGHAVSKEIVKRRAA